MAPGSCGRKRVVSPARHPSEAETRPAARSAPRAGTSDRAPTSQRRGRPARRRPTTAGSASLTACIATVVAATALAGRPFFDLGVLAVQCGLVVGWSRITDVPGRKGAMIIGLGAAGAVDVLLWLEPADRRLGPAATVLAASVLAALFHQLARRGDRSGATESLASSVFGVVLVTLAAAWLPASTTESDSYVATTMLATLAAAALLEAAASALRLPASLRLPAVVVVAAAGGTGVGLWLPFFSPVSGIALGATVGLIGTVAFAAAALSRRYASDRTLFAATIPVAAVGPAAYFLGRLLGG